jgi:hypothetical protein
MFSFVGVIFALLAALLWGWSGNLEPFYAAMKKIARLNGGAAACAFISAVAQALAMRDPLR